MPDLRCRATRRNPTSEIRNPSYCSTCNSLPGLNRTAFPGGIDTSAPVRGLRPIPVLRGLTLNTPNPLSSMRSPCPRAFFMLSKTVSTASSALVLVIPVLLTTSLMISSFITGQLSSIFQKGRNLQMLLDFYAGCQWNSFAYKMASLALHQNPRKTKEPLLNGNQK